MEFQENMQLAPYTTFHIGGPAKFFCEAENSNHIKEALAFAKEKKLEVFVLGGGSNILVNDTGFEGLVIHMSKGVIAITNEDEAFADLKLDAGFDWDKAVSFTVEKGFWGIENLSHIPGNCGAFVVQNVGAYGQEASQVIISVDVFDSLEGTVKTITKQNCNFTYRQSIFNTSEKGRYIIMSVNVKLSKNPQPNLGYGDLKNYFIERNITSPTQLQIREAVTAIRDTKFPYPDQPTNGSAGSFFQGPVITDQKMADIKSSIQQKFGHEAAERLKSMEDRLKIPQGYKTPVAFLLELSGVKGLEFGGAQINPPHPGIILNKTGAATASDVMQLSNRVINLVRENFGIELKIEPELIGFKS